MYTYHKYLKYKKKYLKLKNELFGGMETAEPKQSPKVKYIVKYLSLKKLIDIYKDPINKTKCSANPTHNCELAFIFPNTANITGKDAIKEEATRRFLNFHRGNSSDFRERVQYMCKTCKKECNQFISSDVSDSSQLMDSGDSYNKRHSDTDPELLLSSKKPRSIASSSQESAAAAAASLSQESTASSSLESAAAASLSQESTDSSSLRGDSFIDLTYDYNEKIALVASQKSCAVIDLTTEPDSMSSQQICSAISAESELKTIGGIDFSVFVSGCRVMEAKRDAKNKLRKINPFAIFPKPDYGVEDMVRCKRVRWIPISEEDICIIKEHQKAGEQPLNQFVNCEKGRLCSKQLFFVHTTYPEADVCAINIACKKGHYGRLRYLCKIHRHFT